MTSISNLKSESKKVTISNYIETILIPSKEELLDHSSFDDYWWTDDQLEKIKNEALAEIKVFSYLENISMKQAVKEIYIVKQ